MGAGLQHALGMCGERHRYRDVGVTVLSPGRDAEGGGKGVNAVLGFPSYQSCRAFP